MGALKKQIKKAIESLTGWHIERIKGKSYALLDRRRKTDAWFSLDVQLAAIIEELQVDVVLDVGANEGQFAQEMRSVYAGEIHSFEPVSSAFEKLAAAAASDPNWHIHKVALGSEESTQAINVSRSTRFSSLLKTSDYGARRFADEASGAEEEVVHVRRLDNVLDDAAFNIDGKRVFLKMDTQGYDTHVFNGMGNRLKHVVALQSEVSLIPIYEGMPHWTDSISTYERAGFGVVGMFPITWDSGRIIEYDCLMTRVAV